MGQAAPGAIWCSPPSGWPARGSRSRPSWPTPSTTSFDPRPSSQAVGTRRAFHGRLADFPESVAAYKRPDGQPWKAGDRLVQADLAATLERIADGGPDEFYQGKTAALIAAYMAEHDGFITREDLAGYQAKERPPVKTTFRGHEIYGMGPPSSGGVVLCQMLNILERYDLKADGPRSGRTLHRVTEAMRRAYFTRAARLGDPDFVDVPTAELTSKAAADALAAKHRRAGDPERLAGPVPDPVGRIEPHDPSFGRRR